MTSLQISTSRYDLDELTLFAYVHSGAFTETSRYISATYKWVSFMKILHTLGSKWTALFNNSIEQQGKTFKRKVLNVQGIHVFCRNRSGAATSGKGLILKTLTTRILKLSFEFIEKLTGHRNKQVKLRGNQRMFKQY